MTDDIESYWEGLRPPREPGKEPPKGSVCDHIDPTKIEGSVSQVLPDGSYTFDYQGEYCTVFNPKWYKLHRWFWWLFITGEFFSSYEWTHGRGQNGRVFKAYRRKREWPG